MFMNDFHVEQNLAELYMDDAITSEVLVETAAYEVLLNTVDAARTGLVSGEHDYDIIEEDTL